MKDQPWAGDTVAAYGRSIPQLKAMVVAATEDSIRAVRCACSALLLVFDMTTMKGGAQAIWAGGEDRQGVDGSAAVSASVVVVETVPAGCIAGRDQCKIDGEVRATKVEDRWRSARGVKR